MSDTVKKSNEEQGGEKTTELISLHNYISHEPVVKSKIFFRENLLTLLEQGEKVVHYANSRTVISETQFALLSSGNCLITEKLSLNQHYKSTMFTF